MSNFASGKYAYGISDRSGFRYRLKDMRKEWNGSIVGYDEYEEKHPQLTPPRIRTDLEALRDARPDRIQLLKTVYEEEFERAMGEDRDRSSFTVTPQLSYYKVG